MRNLKENTFENLQMYSVKKVLSLYKILTFGKAFDSIADSIGKLQSKEYF